MSATDMSPSTGDHKILPRAAWELIQAEARELQATRFRLEDQIRELSTQLTVVTAENAALVARVETLAAERDNLREKVAMVHSVSAPDDATNQA